MTKWGHGDLVLAQYGQYPPWPAAVVGLHRGKIEVGFFGSFDVEFLDPASLQLYTPESKRM